MNRGAYQGSLVQQMAGGSPSCWTTTNFRPASGESPPLLLPSSSLSFSQYLQPSNSLSLNCSFDGQQLPQSWSQLLLGGLVSEQERSVKQEIIEGTVSCYSYGHGRAADQEIQATSEGNWATWSHVLPVSSPGSCVTSTLSGNMLDFSNTAGRRHLTPDHSSECNSMETGVGLKKARVQTCSSSQSNTFKFLQVRKEKLGDRITALHQLVSPFGKTDTASVLLEAIGYIRFLQSQIEALSSPYLAAGQGNTCRPARRERSCIFPEDPGQLLNDNCTRKRGPADQEGNKDEPKKDLRSRGLCLVPVSCTLHVGGDNGADYWSPLMGGDLR